MKLIGTRIKKISGERFDVEGKATLENINSNSIPTNLREGKTADKKKKILIIDWEFSSKYKLSSEKNLAELTIQGEIIYETDVKLGNELMDAWKKNKTIEKKILVVILQGILNVAQIEGIILAKELNLPSPVQLVRVKEE